MAVESVELHYVVHRYHLIRLSGYRNRRSAYKKEDGNIHHRFASGVYLRVGVYFIGG